MAVMALDGVPSSLRAWRSPNPRDPDDAQARETASGGGPESGRRGPPRLIRYTRWWTSEECMPSRGWSDGSHAGSPAPGPPGSDLGLSGARRRRRVRAAGHRAGEHVWMSSKGISKRPDTRCVTCERFCSPTSTSTTPPRPEPWQAGPAARSGLTRRAVDLGSPESKLLPSAVASTATASNLCRSHGGVPEDVLHPVVHGEPVQIGG